jgi:CheY-like chemotaxis protein
MEGHPLKILVVEDNVDSAESLGEVLHYWGHRTWLSHNGLDALEQARQVHPDVILLDIGLPGMDGYEVGKRLHAEPALARTTVVALTGYERNDPELSSQAEFDQHFTKPIDLEALAHFLSEVIRAN